ncbi:MAG: metallophosphoesterase family protein, partial [Firmicutes bacterium]|nr:metallophosphoesterase family protein [Bacillota bacterium]
MRIVVYSDTHQNMALLSQSVRQAMADGKIDVLVHCGDGVRDLEGVEAE